MPFIIFFMGDNIIGREQRHWLREREDGIWYRIVLSPEADSNYETATELYCQLSVSEIPSPVHRASGQEL